MGNGDAWVYPEDRFQFISILDGHDVDGERFMERGILARFPDRDERNGDVRELMVHDGELPLLR